MVISIPGAEGDLKFRVMTEDFQVCPRRVQSRSFWQLNVPENPASFLATLSLVSSMKWDQIG